MDAQTPAFETFAVLGVPVSVTTLDTACSALVRWTKDRQGRYVCVRDVHGIMQAYDDSDFKELHRGAAMVTPDGMPLVWVGRRVGHVVERTSGADLISRMYEISHASGPRHFLYGGKEGVASKLKAAFRLRFPEAVTVAAETPPFHELTDEEVQALAERISGSGAEIVWIGLSTPKQEFLMRRLARLCPATLVGVGAAFDFHSGTIKRAPLWMQRSGLEWLHRLISEPRRLWRRYLVMGPRFIWLLLAKRQ